MKKRVGLSLAMASIVLACCSAEENTETMTNLPSIEPFASEEEFAQAMIDGRWLEQIAAYEKLANCAQIAMDYTVDGVQLGDEELQRRLRQQQDLIAETLIRAREIAYGITVKMPVEEGNATEYFTSLAADPSLFAGFMAGDAINDLTIAKELDDVEYGDTTTTATLFVEYDCHTLAMSAIGAVDRLAEGPPKR